MVEGGVGVHVGTAEGPQVIEAVEIDILDTQWERRGESLRTHYEGQSGHTSMHTEIRLRGDECDLWTNIS